ncbi:sulfotransferase 1 family member D1-like [Ptychodera flava]|uniref:sulfotransferase 1 family member D1-like n=1 Tax=Ptychodera flava TaxID=63121 RepID=UPI003969BC5D
METPQPGQQQKGMPSMKLPLEKIKNLEVRQDDVFLLTYPKSGTHWLMEMLPRIVNGGDTSSTISFERQVLPIEFIIAGEGDNPMLLHIKSKYGVPDGFSFEKMESPRLFCSHVNYQSLPAQLHEKKPKVIYLARNAKDVAVSQLNQMSKPPMNIPDDMSVFLENMFVTGAAMGGMGHWGTHVLEWWNKKEEDNVLYLKYEDLKKDLKTGVQQIAKFIGKDLSAEAVDKIVHHCTIDNMKKVVKDDPFQKAMGWKENPFVRKGKTGGWKEKLTVAQSEMMDKHCEEWLKGSGLKFDME